MAISRYNTSFFIFFILFSFTLFSANNFDLSNYDLNGKNIISLKGPWLFYKNQFLSLSDINNTNPTYSIESMPHYWKKNNKTIFGYGTYELKLTGLTPDHVYELKAGPMEDCYSVFFDNKLLFSSGNPGISVEKQIPNFSSKHGIFIPEKTTGSIIIHVSGFLGRYAGPTSTISLANYPVLNTVNEKAAYKTFFIGGGIFILAIFYFFYFILIKSDRSSLYFSLFCIIVAVRTFITGGDYSFFREFADYNIITKLEFLTFTLSNIFFTLFLSNFFINKINKYLINSTILISSFYSLIILFIQVSSFNKFLTLYQIVIFILSTAILVSLIINTKKSCEVWCATFGIFLLFSALINDILYSDSIINTTYLSSYGVLIFIIIYAFIISSRYAKTFYEVKSLSLSLSDKNRVLEDANEKIVKLMNNEIIQNEFRLREVTNNIPTIIIAFDNDGNTIFWNNAADMILGFSITEIPNYHTLVSKIIPDMNFVEKFETKEEFKNLECRAYTKTSQEKIISITNMSKIKIQNWEYWFTASDITNLKLAENQIRISEEKYRFLYEENSSIHIILSSDLTIRDMNKSAARILNFNLEEIVGKNASFIVSGEQFEFFKEKIEASFIGETDEDFEVTLISKSGENIIVLFNPSNIVFDDGNENYSILISGSDITKRKDMETQITNFATFDIMTGCYNRRVGIELISNCLKKSVRNNMSISLCFIDIDGLKHVNDSLGHAHGDSLIINTSNIIKSNIRESDIIIRLGGDEFLLCFQECNKENAEKIWNKVLTSFNNFNSIKNQAFSIHASHGIVEYSPILHKSIDDFIEATDKEMYKEKLEKKMFK